MLWEHPVGYWLAGHTLTAGDVRATGEDCHIHPANKTWLLIKHEDSYLDFFKTITTIIVHGFVLSFGGEKGGKLVGIPSSTGATESWALSIYGAV